MQSLDHYYMQQALSLAKAATRIASPNPGVGCILVKDNAIIGKGATMPCGQDHAEVAALKDCRQQGFSPTGATAYLTLEPCSHYGKTPPCALKLIDAGISRIFIAIADPFSEVGGRGIALMREANIETFVGLLAKEAEEVHRGYLSRIKRGSPWVTLKMASSLDGKAALLNKQSKWITSEASRQDVQILRGTQCAILTGSGTVLADNPRLNVRTPQALQPRRFVIDGKLRTPSSALIYQDRNTQIFTTSKAKIKTESVVKLFHNQGIEVTALDAIGDKVDLRMVLKILGNYGINNLLVEAGPGLAGAMIKAGLIDELIIYMAPIFLGDQALSIVAFNKLTNLNEAIRFKIYSSQMVGPDLKLVCRFNALE